MSAVSNPFFKLSLRVDIHISATIDNWLITLICKVGLSPWKKLFCVNESFLKMMKKCFLHHVKSSFCSQDIENFILIFWSCRKSSLIWKMRLISKFQSLSHNSLFNKCWVPNPRIPFSKPLGGSKVDSAFHLSEVDRTSNKNFWKLSGKK